MKMHVIKRVLLVLTGIILIAVVVYLDFLSTKDTSYILWFGLASALIAPVGISSIASTFKISENNTLKKLLKVPEIEELIRKAETQEEKIKILQEERKQLSELVKYETIKHAILERKRYLENEAERIISEIEDIDNEMNRLISQETEMRASNEVIEKLYERLNSRKNNILKDDLFIYSLFNAIPLPFASSIAFMLWKSIKSLFHRK